MLTCRPAAGLASSPLSSSSSSPSDPLPLPEASPSLSSKSSSKASPDAQQHRLAAMSWWCNKGDPSVPMANSICRLGSFSCTTMWPTNRARFVRRPSSFLRRRFSSRVTCSPNSVPTSAAVAASVHTPQGNSYHQWACSPTSPAALQGQSFSRRAASTPHRRAAWRQSPPRKVHTVTYYKWHTSSLKTRSGRPHLRAQQPPCAAASAGAQRTRPPAHRPRRQPVPQSRRRRRRRRGRRRPARRACAAAAQLPAPPDGPPPPRPAPPPCACARPPAHGVTHSHFTRTVLR